MLGVELRFLARSNLGTPKTIPPVARVERHKKRRRFISEESNKFVASQKRQVLVKVASNEKNFQCFTD